MRVDTLIRGGIVVTPDGMARQADLGIADGVIAAVGPELSGPADQEVDATGLHVLPGLIDAHVHFNDPGRDHWEGIASGSAALAAGGGTCFVDMPLNSSPPTLDGPSFDAKLARARAHSRTDFAFYGGLTPVNLDHMEELAERGVVGYKAFMCPSGIDDFQWSDDDTLLRGMEIAARLDLPVLLHAESAAITGAETRRVREAGRSDVRAFLESRPVIAELEAINRALLYAEETGCRVHIVHVSNRRGVELVRRAAAKDWVDASCETCPHYLMLTGEDMAAIGPAAKCAPPLRDEATRGELLRALIAGEIDTVGSDHSPAPAEMKEGSTFLEAWGGIAGVQTTLRTLMSLDVPPARIADVTAHAPARRFRLSGKQGITPGADADLTLVDTGSSSVLTRDELRDRHRMNPLVGRPLTGSIRGVYLRGRPIGDDTRGRLITPAR